MFGMTHEIYFSYIKKYIFIFSQAWDPNEKIQEYKKKLQYFYDIIVFFNYDGSLYNIYISLILF